ncbi:putative membrane-associated protein [Halovivax ruber XH-70]|uniref:Putative membrane-associated protein n=1 Tax=Halovivax ruber (strain DSM 18193 / JCM 13892 / XH-70) TaxID=797302 RepID=L0IDR0_HALRX|nr:VTT domain-containing protein [Halovivax ruber]AGB16968.1 putative membrane-associated protein [Halovivax ruber XH-70]
MDPLLSVLIAFGFCLFFVIEGLVLGKLLQPAVFYVAYVTFVDPSTVALAVVTCAAALGATIGQWLLYRTFTPTRPPPGARYWSPERLERLPGVLRRWAGKRWVSLVERQIDRFGAYGIAVCTAIPGVRTVVPIIAGVGAQPERGYVIADGAGNLVYMLLLLGAAYGVLGISRLFIGL